LVVEKGRHDDNTAKAKEEEGVDEILIGSRKCIIRVCIYFQLHVAKNHTYLPIWFDCPPIGNRIRKSQIEKKNNK